MEPEQHYLLACIVPFLDQRIANAKKAKKAKAMAGSRGSRILDELRETDKLRKPTFLQWRIGSFRWTFS
jgi:hypothetical protein